MRAIVCGANGAMGKLICAALGDEVIGKVSIDGENGVPKTFEELGEISADVVIDFSHHTAVADVLAYAKKIGSAAVIGTTGHTPEEKALIYAAAEEIPVFYAGNVSLGIAVPKCFSYYLLCLSPEHSTVNGAQSMFGDSPMNISHDVWFKQ